MASKVLRVKGGQGGGSHLHDSLSDQEGVLTVLGGRSRGWTGRWEEGFTPLSAGPSFLVESVAGAAEWTARGGLGAGEGLQLRLQVHDFVCDHGGVDSVESEGWTSMRDGRGKFDV